MSHPRRGSFRPIHSDRHRATHTQTLEYYIRCNSQGLFNNTVLIWSQKPEATMVAGYRAWQAKGRQVRRGEQSIKVFGPVTTREPKLDDHGRPVRSADGKTVQEVRIVGVKPVSVFDVSQTDGDPLPEPPQATLLTGQAPPGLWDALQAFVEAQGYTVSRGDSGGANGVTMFDSRQVRVRVDIDDAASVKTLAHDLLTAPTGVRTRVWGGGCADDTPLSLLLPLPFMVLCWARRHGSTGEGVMAGEQDLESGSRDVKRLVVPVVGAVATTDEVPGTALLDASGRPVVEVAEFFRGMLASGANESSLRSYGLALLRWWRFLAAVEVPWDRAGRVEAQDFVLWMRMVGPAGRPGGYAPATINHGLAVVKAFYADRLAAGRGPVVNPVPEAAHRDGRRVQAHHNPMQPFAPGPRAPLAQKVPERVPRSIPDGLFDALFTAVRSDRDRALLAFWVSTGARAGELLGATLDRVDPGEQRIGVVRKGSRRLQWLPASADAFVWWRLYEARVTRPAGERALWLTNRSPVRPLTYPAARRMLQRANDALGTVWTLHDLRHTAAQRMIDDPHLSLTDVQWVLGHAHLTTTQLYLRSRPDEVIAKVLEHHRARAERPPVPRVPPGAPGYPADVLEALLGGGRRG
jgi:integrase